jgi:hypothetical protein
MYCMEEFEKGTNYMQLLHNTTHHKKWQEDFKTDW